MIKQTFTRTALAAVVAAGFFAAAPAQAQTYGIYQDHQFDYTTLLTGNITDNAWVNLSAFAQAGVPGLTGTGGFPGTTPWASPQASQINNSVGSVGGSLGGATLNKLANGAGGGPYAASGGIYYGGMSSTVNYDGGRLGVADSTPLSGLETVVLQVGIGEAWTYDFYNGQLPTLSFNYGTSGSVTGLAADFSTVLEKFDNGTVTMPTGEETVYINQHALQWDLTGYSDISSLEIAFNGVQHAQLYGLTLTQSDVYTQVVAVVPEPGTYAMLMAGLGIIGGVARRRRKALDA